MAGFTNRGKSLLLAWGLQQVEPPVNLYVALCTAADAPDADTKLLSELTEIAAGKGYTAGGYELVPGTDFTLFEDDAEDWAYIQVKDVEWLAAAGPIPVTGAGARYAVLTDDEVDPNIIGYWDLVTPRQVSDTQTLTLEECELRLTES